MAEVIGALPSNYDPLHWARNARRNAALTNVIAAFMRCDSRFTAIVQQHIQTGRLWFDNGVLKVGRTNN